MPVDVTDLQRHLNMTPDEAKGEAYFVLSNLLRAASAHTEAQLGFKLTDEVEFPSEVPPDVRHAILMLAAHWFEQREATVVGVTMQTAPLGYDDIIASHRSYTFG